MSLLDNSMSHKGGKRRNYTMKLNVKLLNMLRKIVIIKQQKNFMLLLKGLENGDKAN